MARIKIKDLPVLEDLPQEEQKGIFGGIGGSDTGPPINITFGITGGKPPGSQQNTTGSVGSGGSSTGG